MFLAAILRFYQLGAVPPSPDWDEAALGYNAYSILKTGRDEYGTRLPLSLRSFDDYKPPLYMYLAVPAVATFGLNTWAVRLPSVLAGILAVLGTYLLVCQLSGQNKKLPLLAALLLAISPWHLQFSRIAFEANIGVTLNIWLLVTFLWGLQAARWWWVSAFIAGLSLYAYHSERIFVPLLVFVLAIVFYKRILDKWRIALLAILIGLATAAALIPVFIDPTTLTRLRGTSALADQTALLYKTTERLVHDLDAGDKLGVVFDNRRVVWTRKLLEGYLAHYSLRWLFITGDNPRHHAPGMGLLYLFELPFLIIGLLFLPRYKHLAKLIFPWLLIAPIAAAPTTELPHGIRTLVFLPALQIVVAVGITVVSRAINNWRTHIASWVLVGFTMVAGVNFVYFLHMYFQHTNPEVSRYWQYGYEQAAQYAKKVEDNYDKIVVSTKLEQPHMFFLFYLKFDPVRYLAEGGTTSGGFAERFNRFGKYEFRPINWSQETKDGKTLFIAHPGEISPAVAQITINYLDNSPAITISQ